MTPSEWQCGWQKLMNEAVQRGTIGVATTVNYVPDDLWRRIVAFGPKPAQLNDTKGSAP